MFIRDRVADRHWSGQGEFKATFGLCAGEPYLLEMHRSWPRQRPDNCRHLEILAIITDTHHGLFVPIDAVNLFHEAVHKMCAELFAVGDNVYPGFFF